MYPADDNTQKLMQRFRNQLFSVGAEHGDDATVAEWAAVARNDRCGDSVELFARYSSAAGESGRCPPPASVLELVHCTVGCSICQVSADFLCEAARGRTGAELCELIEQVRCWLNDTAAPLPNVPGIRLFDALRGRKTRARCLLLPYEAAERLVLSAS